MPSWPTYRATANSSPPMRDTTSVGRVTDSSRWAASRSTRSPTWWPQVSLTSLNESMSRKSRSTRSPCAAARSSSSSTISTSLRAVDQPGQRVVGGLVAQALLSVRVVLDGGDGPHQQQHGDDEAGHGTDPGRDHLVVADCDDRRRQQHRQQESDPAARPGLDRALLDRRQGPHRGVKGGCAEEGEGDDERQVEQGRADGLPLGADVRVADVADQHEDHRQPQQPERRRASRRGPGQQDRHEDHRRRRSPGRRPAPSRTPTCRRPRRWAR